MQNFVRLVLKYCSRSSMKEEKNMEIDEKQIFIWLNIIDELVLVFFTYVLACTYLTKMAESITFFSFLYIYMKKKKCWFVKAFNFRFSTDLRV